MSSPAGDIEGLYGRYTARVNQVDIARPPLVIEENGQILKIYLHPHVPMRYHFISQVDSRCIVSRPGEATHILLDLLPPHDHSSSSPTEEERGYIYHRGDRHVLCGYWAQECLRVGGVAETGFWDLSGWSNMSTSGQTNPASPVSSDPVGKPSHTPATRLPGAAAASSVRGRIAKARKSDPAKAASTRRSGNQGQKKRKRTSLTPAMDDQVNGAGSSASVASESIQEETDRRRSLPARPSVELKLRRTTRNSVQSSNPTVSPAPTHYSVESSTRRRTSEVSDSEDEGSLHGSLRKRRTYGGTKKVLPKLGERSSEEIQEIWNFFIREIHLRLGTPIPEDAKMGNVDTVKQWMLTRVHEMWCEARSRYNRRNLDHLSIMLSTWKTAREFNLSPFALRKYYDDFHGRIAADKTPYIPVKDRPPSWPFHDKPPVNAEAGISWINEWEPKQHLAGDVEVAEGQGD